MREYSEVNLAIFALKAPSSIASIEFSDEGDDEPACCPRS